MIGAIIVYLKVDILLASLDRCLLSYSLHPSTPSEQRHPCTMNSAIELCFDFASAAILCDMSFESK
jgi:hypothetical protein